MKKNWLWETIKEIAGDVYLVTACGWILFHLIAILLKERVTIYEPNIYVLWGEIIYTGGAFILGLERLVKDFIERGKN